MLSHPRLGNGVVFRICALSLVIAALFAAGCSTSSGSGYSGPPPFTVTTTSAQLPTPTVNSAFSYGLSVANGTAPFTFTLTSGMLPTGITLASDGSLTGTPTQSGSFNFTVMVKDSAGHTATANLTINVDQAPTTITSVGQVTFTVGTSGSFAVTVAAGAFPAPTFSETGTLPQGVMLSSAGVLSGTPAAGTGGAYPIMITAQNGTMPNATQAFTLTVDEAPAITVQSGVTTFAFQPGTSVTFTLTASGFPTPTLSEQGALPSGITFVDNGNGTATLGGNPSGPGKDYPITVTAHNGIGTDASRAFTVRVAVPPAITSATNTTFTVGSSGTFTVTATGFPAPMFTETGTLPMGVSFNTATGVLSGTPAAGTGKVYPIMFTAQNALGATTPQSFTLTVNEAPTFTSATSAQFAAGSSNTFTVAAAGFPVPALSEMGSLPSGVTFVDNGNGTATIAGNPAGPANNYPIAITATNSISSVQQPFTLMVVVQTVPTITSPNSAAYTAHSPTPISFTITTTGAPAPAITVTGLPSGVNVKDNGDGTATIYGPTPSTISTYALTIKATNSSGSATQSFTLSIVAKPTINIFMASPTPITAGGTSTLTATFSNGGAGGSAVITNNVDSSTITLTPSATIVTVNMNVTPSTTTTYTLTVKNAAGGALGTATSLTILTVVPAPVITSFTANPTTIVSGQMSTLTALFANGTGGTAVITNNVDSSSISATNNVGVMVSPTRTTTYTLTVKNSLGASAPPQQVIVTVDAPPAFTSSPNATFIVNTSSSFTVTTSGNPAPSLSFTGTLPTGVTFTANANGTATIGGTATATGTFNITITASNTFFDSSVHTATQSFTLTVTAAPAVVGTATPLPIFAGNPVQTILITVTNDAAGDTLAVIPGTVDDNTGLPCTPVTCGTFGTPTFVTLGHYTLSYTPPLTSGFTAQTVQDFVVKSSLTGSFAATDSVEVDPPGRLVNVGFLRSPNIRAGVVQVGAPQQTADATVYNDTFGDGAAFNPLTASGYACPFVSGTSGPTICGLLGTPATPTGAPTSDTQVPYTPPTAVPAPPYDRPLIKASAFADGSRFASLPFLLSTTLPANTGLRIPTGGKINSALAGGNAIQVGASVGNDTGTNLGAASVTWTLKDTNGVNCLPTTCGSLGTPVVTTNGNMDASGNGIPNSTFVTSTVTYTPPASYPPVAADQTPTITATSVDNPAATDNFTFTIADEACGPALGGHESLLNGQYAFMLKGGGANAGYGALIGSFTADGNGNITGGPGQTTGGVLDENTSAFGPTLGDSIQSKGSFYRVGADNRVCMVLTDSFGSVLNFRAAVGTIVSNVATQGRIILFNDNNGRRQRLSGVLMKQNPTSFSASQFNGNYAFGFAGVSFGRRAADVGVLTAAGNATTGTGTLSNLTRDESIGGAPVTMTGSGSYTLATNAPSGRGTGTVMAGLEVSHLVFYMVSSSEILAMTTDNVTAPLTVTDPIETGELKKQNRSFSSTTLDNKSYVFYLEGLDPASGGNEAGVGQATFTTNGKETFTTDFSVNGGTVTPQTGSATATIDTSTGRTTFGTNSTFLVYLIDSSSAFELGTGTDVLFGFVEQQTGGLSTASFNTTGQPPFFFGADTPTAGAEYQSGTVALDGLGNVNGSGDVSGPPNPSGLHKQTISPANGGTYSFPSPAGNTIGQGTVGGDVAFAVSASKIIFLQSKRSEITIVEK